MDKKLERFLNSNDCYFIHYASDGFYNGSNPAPKISCIVIYNLKTNQCHKFSISEHLDTDLTDVELAESELLDDFNFFVKKFSDVCFIHWNMQADGFGFKALQARADDLCIEFPMIPKENLFDLASYVEYLGGKKLSIKQILWFNYFLDDYFLDGKTEAEYFARGKFGDILSSVHSKVVGLSCVVDAIRKGNLKTEKPFTEPNNSLTKEERREQALKIAQAREQILKDIVEHNRKMLRKREEAFEQSSEKQEEGFLFFDSEHPLLSLFASWFGNGK